MESGFKTDARVQSHSVYVPGNIYARRSDISQIREREIITHEHGDIGARVYRPILLYIYYEYYTYEKTKIPGCGYKQYVLDCVYSKE